MIGYLRSTMTTSLIWFLALIGPFTVILMPSTAQAATKIGIVVFDGVLTSDVTAPIEVFGAASKKHGSHPMKL